VSEYQWPNLAVMFFEQADVYKNNPFLWAKRDGVYDPLGWEEAATRVISLARGLVAKGVEPGDRVMLVAENSPMWFEFDFAIMSIGAITVPAYTTNTKHDHLHVLSDSGAKAALVSSRKLARPLLDAAMDAPDVSFIATAESMEQPDDANYEVLNVEALNEAGHDRDDDIREMAQNIKIDDVCSIIYTSGTGGKPKGVMLTHRNQFHNCAGASDALLELDIEHERFLSFLPLSHSYEHMAGYFYPISIGAEIYYAESVEGLATNMGEMHPTIMTAVPRLYEILYEKIMKGVRKQGGLKETLFEKTLSLGKKKYEDPNSLNFIERAIDGLLDKLVRQKVRERFGGQLKALVSGGAPLNPDIGLFFTALGLRILQGYGQTETAPVISVNRPSSMRVETVGPPLLNTNVKIADDGEILVSGDLVMKGYWKNPEATAETIIDGWVHTGDIGEFTSEGHLKITDRKKDLIVNSGGDNIAPQRLEGMLALEHEIAQAMVFGDKRPYISALIVPEATWLKDWAKENGKTGELAELANDPDLHKALSPVVKRVNEHLSKIENIRRYIISAEAFTIENEMMTPTMKVRRYKVMESYGSALEGLYR